MDIGINPGPVTYFTTNPFLNRFLTAANWTDATTKAAITNLDANGYPTSLATGVVAIAAFGLDPGELTGPTDFVCTYEGEGTVKITAGKTTVKSSAPGRILFSAAGTVPYAILQIVATNPANPVRNIRVVRVDEESLLQSGQIFRQAYVDKFKGMKSPRFMDWLQTNNPYTGHTPVSYYSYGAPNHVPVEICVAFADLIGARAWLNVHDQGDDAYQDAFIAKAKAAKLPPIIEFSNEVAWNTGFPQSKRAATDGVARYPDLAGVYAGEALYGYRATLLAKKARAAGLLPVLGVQTANIGLAQYTLRGMADAGGKDSDFYGWIIANYVRGSLTSPDGPILDLLARNDIAGAIDNMISAPAPAKSVATMAAVYQAHGDFARKHGWKLLAYEGGPHLDALSLNKLPNFQTIKGDLVKFLTAVLRDPARAKFEEANLSALEAAGCELACAFNLDGAPSEFGIFGYYGTPGWDVLQRWIKAAVPVPTPPPVVTPDPVPAKPTLAEIVADLDALKAKLLARG